MTRFDWTGVIPAITTPFLPDDQLDLQFLGEHARWMVAAGCTGIVAPGSLGEGATLSFEEKRALWSMLAEALRGNAAPLAAIAATSTREAVREAQAAAAAGCVGLMVLPPYIYKGEWREMRAHFSAVIAATPLTCMLYNNPIAYGTDVLPGQMSELAALHPNLHAVKESSGDVRRITAIREQLGSRLTLLVGMDDCLVEGVQAGARGWIAGLVNAFPAESVRLFELAQRGPSAELDALYHWFLPLLRMDTTYDFVQRIKLAQEQVGRVGRGGARVRAPRMQLDGQARQRDLDLLAAALAKRPVFRTTLS